MGFNPSEARVPAGSAGGGRWGGGGSSSKSSAPRSADAAKAQANPKAAAMYDKLNSLSPAERAKYLQGLSAGDLELLTQAVYGTRTSDPKVVQSRVAVANEMGKRGLDIKKNGALGGGSPAAKKPTTPTRKVTAAQHKVIANVQARKAAQAATTARQTSQVHSATSVRAQ